MSSVIRNVRDIDSHERQMLERVIGQQLQVDQQIIIQVVPLKKESVESLDPSAIKPSGLLPDWCNVFTGLTDKQIGEVEDVVLRRADLTRPTE